MKCSSAASLVGRHFRRSISRENAANPRVSAADHLECAGCMLGGAGESLPRKKLSQFERALPWPGSY
jgi:hypothetical protein